jgi:hypothetical protein
LASGERKLGPDLDFHLAADNSVNIQLNDSNTSAEVNTDAPLTENVSLSAIADDSKEVLKKVRYHLHFAPAHANVRKVEQRKLLEMISDARAAWIVAEWGMGGEVVPVV